MDYYESKTYGKVCEMAFEIDLKQCGMMPKAELELLLEKSVFNETQNILEVGCGAGQIAAYISNISGANFLCVDKDEKAIEWASKTCKNNKIKYQVFDVKNILELNRKFDKVLAIDSLYFLTDMRIDGFYEALKQTLYELHSLLENNGEMIILWSELPFFKPERKAPECTQIGLCLKELGYSYNSIDLTESESILWKKFKDALVFYEKDFLSEGNKSLFDEHISEADFWLERIEKELLYRNMYLIKK